MWYDVTIAPLDRLCFSSSLSAFWSWCIELRDFMSGHLDWAPQAFTSSTPFLLSPVLLPLSVCVHTQAPALHLFCCVMNKCLLSLTSLPHVCGIPAKHRACGGGGTASHYFTADKQQCVQLRLNKWKTEALFFLWLFLPRPLRSPILLLCCCVCLWCCPVTLVWFWFVVQHVVLSVAWQCRVRSKNELIHSGRKKKVCWLKKRKYHKHKCVTVLPIYYSVYII